jgi:hypothetical protein
MVIFILEILFLKIVSLKKYLCCYVIGGVRVIFSTGDGRQDGFFPV